MPLRIPSPSSVLIASLVLIAGCNEAPTQQASPAAPIVQGEKLRFVADHPHLKLLPVQGVKAATAISVELPAKLVWNEDRTQRLYPPFAGRVMSIRADVGQKVSPGTTLALLASPDFGQAQSDTAKAEADVALAQKTLRRQSELLEAGIVARKDFELAQAESQRAQAELERARARTRLYGSNSSSINQQLALSSSINGVVVERNLNPGQELRPDQSGPGIPAAFVVSDPGSLWVQIDARESELGVLQPGTPFELQVAALQGQRFFGKVIAASDFIDPLTRTVKYRGLIDNRERLLKAEMLATAKVERPFKEGALSIPASALFFEDASHQVFVRVGPGEFERRKVSLIHEGSQEVIVGSGLQPSDLVVTNNVLLLARQFRPFDVKTPNPAETGVGTAK